MLRLHGKLSCAVCLDHTKVKMPMVVQMKAPNGCPLGGPIVQHEPTRVLSETSFLSLASVPWSPFHTLDPSLHSYPF